MHDLFDQFGKCDIRVLMDKYRGTAKGIAFVEYGTVDEMKAAIGKKQILIKLFLQTCVKLKAS